jgi:NAD(P)H dehydrogenase (quinone)
MTTGGQEPTFEELRNGEMEKILFPIQHGMFYFTGMTVLPPFISYAPARKSEPELKSEIENYKSYLDNLSLLKPIYSITNL